MPYASRRDLVRYGLALVSVGGTLAVQQTQSGLSSVEVRFLVLLLPVLMSSWWGGRGPGFVATVLAALGADYAISSLVWTVRPLPDADLAIFLFVTNGILISLLAGMLHQSERRNVVIRRTAMDGVLTADFQGRIVDSNAAAEQLFGYRRSELLGKDWTRLLVPRSGQYRHPADLWRELRTKSKNGVGQREELTALHADGTTFPVDLSLTMLPQNDGPPLFASFIRDIRPRKQLEQQLDRQTQITGLLRQANALLSTTRPFESVLQSCLDMVCEITGWPLGRIYLPEPHQRLLVSSRVCHNRVMEHGQVAEPLRFALGEGLPGRIWETGEPEWEEHQVSQAWNADQPLGLESDIRGKFGFPVKVNEEVVAVMEFLTTDVTPPSDEILSLLGNVGEQLGQVIERRRREEQLRKARDAAEAANRAKSEFLANVSHEVRTPMNAVLGVLQVVLTEDLSRGVREHLLTATDSAKTLMSLLNDLLDFSRMEAGRFELELSPFHLREAVQASLKSLAFKAQEKNLQLACHIAPDVPDQLIGDVRRLRQVLMNLVGNAIKFTHQGEIAVSVTQHDDAAAIPSHSQWSPQRDGDPSLHVALRLTVADTGIGIHPDDQARIFEPFTQVDSSSTRRHAGTGLGLTICSELVRRMGGTMWVESKLGEGSRFHCILQFHVPPNQKSPGRQEPIALNVFSTPTNHPLRVLLAEDTPANQKVVSAILAKRGHHVEIARDGRETIDKLREGEFDVILMDVQMPNIDGYQATRAIRELPRREHAKIPIVAMTAHAMSGDREHCLAAGMDEYIPKPIDAVELIHTVERVVEKNLSPALNNLPSAKMAK